MSKAIETLQKAWKVHQAGNVAEAERLYRGVLERDPGNADAWCYLGMACHDRGRLDEAVAAYRRALQLRPAFPVAFNNLGNSLQRQRRFDEALASFDEALRQKPDYLNAHRNKGLALLHAGDLPQALACYRKALEVDADDAVTHKDLGVLHLLRGEGVTSVLKISRVVKMFELVPISKWLFRLDAIVDNEGSTGLHSHPGSGIRCMLEGQLRVRSDKGESSDNTQPGDCWYEEGAYPLVSTSDPGNKATFLRGMVLPPEYDKYPDTAIWIEGTKTCKSDWRSYFQKVVTLR